jgi:DNA-binding NtrC family response regulator
LPEALAKDCPGNDMLPLMQPYSFGTLSLKEMMRNIERNLISEALGMFGSVTKAAEALQVDRTTLFRKMKAAGEHQIAKDKKKT